MLICFYVAYVITYYFPAWASLLGFTSLPAVYYNNSSRTIITGHRLCSMCVIIVGRQYFVSSEIYIIWICKHIKCWDHMVFNMCQTPSQSSAWCDHLVLLHSQEGNPHLSTGPHLGASLSGTFYMILCLYCHSFDAIMCGIRIYQDHETLIPWRLNGKCVLFSRSWFFPGVVSNIYDVILKGSLQFEIWSFFRHFSIQHFLYSAIWLWMYIMNASNDHLHIFFILSRSAPENFSAISPPALKECDPTQLLVIPCFSRPSETMALLTFTLMPSFITWYFVPLSQ